ncbi:MAG TPA: Type 1 glutamine amidotransferase-like domain-containing protein [Thermoanaerobaculia bacterium]|nr:Type 1 glutamine amidotransferase-like domain-containing protein [Thermoanaerobaculia bacterium]
MIKPVFLLGDSQLLFWRENDALFLERARTLLAADANSRELNAAYLGASNGDAPEFYELFVAAMEQVGIRRCRMIRASPEPAELAFLAEADLILLAGGSVQRGWEAFQAAGLPARIIERYYGGALLIGVSAGAVQLGLKGWSDDGEGLFDALRVVPFVVDAHGEPGWARLQRAVAGAGEHARGLGVPGGGGALYHPDYSVEPVRAPVVEMTVDESGSHQALLFPGGPGGRGDSGSQPGHASPDATARIGASRSSPTAPARDEEPAPLERPYTIGPDGVIEIHRGIQGESAGEIGDRAPDGDPARRPGVTLPRGRSGRGGEPVN